MNKVFDYLIGNYRYILFYSPLKFLIRKHIREQIAYRINSMDILCYTKGSCIACGCTTTELQMCNRACDKDCYPAMVDKKTWNLSYNYFENSRKEIVFERDEKLLKFNKMR